MLLEMSWPISLRFQGFSSFARVERVQREVAAGVLSVEKKLAVNPALIAKRTSYVRSSVWYRVLQLEFLSYFEI